MIGAVLGGYTDFDVEGPDVDAYFEGATLRGGGGGEGCGGGGEEGEGEEEEEAHFVLLWWFWGCEDSD